MAVVGALTVGSALFGALLIPLWLAFLHGPWCLLMLFIKYVRTGGRVILTETYEVGTVRTLRARVAELEARCDKDDVCHGSLCYSCTKRPADSHDGCRLRAAQAGAVASEDAMCKAYETAEYESHWRKQAEAQIVELKKETWALSKLVCDYEKERFSGVLTNPPAPVPQKESPSCPTS